MKIGVIEVGGRRTLALSTPKGAVELSRLAKSDASASKTLSTIGSVDELLRGGPDALASVAKHATTTVESTVAEPKWRSPFAAPQKICGIGLNYLDHCREQNLEPPKAPVLFAKYPSAIIGPDDAITWDPKGTQAVDYEAELGVVIGKKTRNVAKGEALAHVAGYVAANDVTARDWQKSDGQFVRAKSLDTFCPLGPFFVTADEVPDPHNLSVQSRVNGDLRQNSSTKNLIFGVDHLVSYLSRAFTLLPGDIILTGTPGGVGAHRKPPEFLKNGDKVEVQIEKLGTLRNVCRT